MQEKARKIIEFLSNEENEYACERCFYNEGRKSDIEKCLPCGQQNCWVSCTCGKVGRG